MLLQLGIYALPVSDSLLLEIKSTEENKDKILLLNELSRSFLDNDIDSAIFYANNGLLQSMEIDFKLGIAENSASLGDYYVIYDSLHKAMEYYNLANKYFQEIDKDFDYAQILMIKGNIFLSQSNYSKALMNYQNSLKISEENNYDEILPHLYNNIGLIYIHLGENQKALDYLTKAYKGFNLISLKNNIAHVLSNIAAIHRSESNDSLALTYYNESLLIFLETNNLADASLVIIDLGNYEFSKGNYEKALEYYQDAFEKVSNNNNEYMGPKSRLLVMIYGSMGQAHSRMGNIEKAISYFEKTKELAYKNDYVNWIETSALELSKIYEDKGDFAKSLKYFKIYEQYGDTLLNENNIKRITQLEMQFEFDKRMQEGEIKAALKEAKQKRKEIVYFLIITLGVFVSVLTILMYLNQRGKTAKIELKRQNLKLKHEKLQQKLDHRNKELATNVMYLLSKNEFITSTAEKLTKAKMNFKKENQKLIQDIIRDLLLNSSKDIWKEFEVRFQEVHSDFYDNLNSKFPDLTPNEKKICAFLRLNMSTKDISSITYQSLRSINMARFRLRKKMNLDTDENLVSFLSHF